MPRERPSPAVTNAQADRTVPSADREYSPFIVDAIGRFGAVTTSVVLQSEAPKGIGRALLMATKRA